MFLTRYETTRLIGLRALQLSEGDEAKVMVEDEELRRNFVYVAACELYDGKLDARIQRTTGPRHVRELRAATELPLLLNTLDGGSRPLYTRP